MLRPSAAFGKKRAPFALQTCYTAAAMNAASLTQLVPVLQLAVGPVILISGVGLLQLSLTNRLGRLVDRARSLVRERVVATAPDVPRIDAQLGLIDRRAGILKGSITLGALTVLFVSVLILVLFFSALFQREWGLLIIALFGCALLALIGSILLFIREMNLSLVAVRLEIRRE
jgi:uncharacterized protein DUF2721